MLALGLAALFAFTVVAGRYGIMALRREMEQRAAEKKSMAEMQQAAKEEQQKMAEGLRAGNPGSGEQAIGRILDQLRKALAVAKGDDATGIRAMQKILVDFQDRLRAYEAAVAQLQKAEIFTFEITDRESLESHRKIVREFLEANEKLKNGLEHVSERARAELEKTKMPAAKIGAFLDGLNKSMANRDVQLRIRSEDKELGEAALAADDLLDREWGKWTRDPEKKQITFENTSALESFNEQIQRVQKAAREQGDAQKELADRLQGK